MVVFVKQLTVCLMLLLAALPSSTNYKLNNFTYGNSGTAGSSSTNYKVQGTAGEQTGTSTSTSTNYQGNPGHNQTQQANVPPAPTFTNPSNDYDKLHFVVSTGSNPSDAKFALAISSDNFVTTYYVHPDDTISTTFTAATDYQTFTAWGGASGQNVIGLTPNTTYKLKVKAQTGNYTETQFGPTASAATVAQSTTFDIDVSATNSSTSPPYAVSFGSLTPATVVTAPVYIWVSLDTNGDSGGQIYITSANAGLRSSAVSYTIASATTNLGTATEGEGAQVISATQTSGGPLSATSPYNGSSQNVGVTDTTTRQIFSTSGPIVGGRGQVALMALAKALTPAANDYADTLTMVAAGRF